MQAIWHPVRHLLVFLRGHSVDCQRRRCRRGRQTQAIRCARERLGVPRVLRPGKVDVEGASAAHRSERVQRYRQQLVRRAAVRRIQEPGRLLVHQLPAGAAETCRHLRQNHVGGAVRRSHGIRLVPDQQSRMAIHQLRQSGRHQGQCGYECVWEQGVCR